MPWFHFEKDHDFRPKRGVMQSFVAGQVKMVTTPCSDDAFAKGKGRVTKRPAGKKTTKAGETVDE